MKLKSIICLLIVFTTFIGCEDFLEENPKDFLSPNNLPKTVADADLMLMGAISHQRSQDFYERAFFFLAGISSDDMAVRYTSGNRFEIDRYTYLSDNEYVWKVWASAYRIINETNTMIHKIPMANINEKDKEQYVAAAKFLRALYYFHLVRLYGDKVMLLDKPIEDFNGALTLKPSSIQEVYNLIEADVLYAVGKNSEGDNRLPTEDWNSPGKPTYGAAKALEAKVFLTMAGYPLNQTDKMTLAKDAAQEVMLMPRYAVDEATDLKEMWLIANEESPEFIYSIQNHLPDYGSILPVQFRPDGWRIMIGSEYHYLKFFAPEDLRGEAYHILEWDGKPYTTFSGKQPYVGKWVDINRDKLSDFSKRTESNIPVFRISEVFLMFAEAENFVNGPTQAAYDAINPIRVRAGLAPLSGLTKNEFFEELKNERARELTMECKRRFDLHRWGDLEEALLADPFSSVNFNMAEHEYFPAPEREVLLNPELEN